MFGYNLDLTTMMQRLRASQTLSDEIISRYSRQLLLPQMGASGMRRLTEGRVLVVGAGGLGCPSAMYLASAGVGCIGIVEYDTVDLSNLHRQIGHREASIGKSKAVSLIDSLKALNSAVNYVAFETQLNRSNATEIAKGFDIIVDASDNVSTRYLLNDLCVLQNKPLVSGSALRWDGQLTVYNFNGGPCYRCIFPRPPPPETVTNCSDGGVMGPVTGIIGSIQALEVIKILLGEREGVSAGKLLLYDGLSGCFRNVKLRSRDPNCAVCGEHPSVRDLVDYDRFCQATACDKTPALKLLRDEDRYTPDEFRSKLLKDPSTRVVDVRPKNEFDLCHIPDAINVPFCMLEKNLNEARSKFEDGTIVVCRRGNDSQKAVDILRQLGIFTKDVKGGLTAWATLKDVSFPMY